MSGKSGGQRGLVCGGGAAAGWVNRRLRMPPRQVIT
ncbi:hypothetical protein OKW41_007533 [Paraburkholderia sp. UCT70]